MPVMSHFDPALASAAAADPYRNVEMVRILDPFGHTCGLIARSMADAYAIPTAPLGAPLGAPHSSAAPGLPSEASAQEGPVPAAAPAAVPGAEQSNSPTVEPPLPSEALAKDGPYPVALVQALRRLSDCTVHQARAYCAARPKLVAAAERHLAASAGLTVPEQGEQLIAMLDLRRGLECEPIPPDPREEDDAAPGSAPGSAALQCGPPTANQEPGSIPAAAPADEPSPLVFLPAPFSAVIRCAAGLHQAHQAQLDAWDARFHAPSEREWADLDRACSDAHHNVDHWHQALAQALHDAGVPAADDQQLLIVSQPPSEDWVLTHDAGVWSWVSLAEIATLVAGLTAADALNA